MNNMRTISMISLVLGVVLVIVSVLADMIGVGSAPGFGYKQIVGSIVGIVLVGAGYVLNSRK